MVIFCKWKADKLPSMRWEPAYRFGLIINISYSILTTYIQAFTPWHSNLLACICYQKESSYVTFAAQKPIHWTWFAGTFSWSHQLWPPALTHFTFSTAQTLQALPWRWVTKCRCWELEKGGSTVSLFLRAPSKGSEPQKWVSWHKVE